MDIRQAIGFITGKAAKHPYPEHMQDARKIAADGIVLLKNEGDLLPLAEKELALFGAGAVDTIVCGSGSGYVMAPYTINVMQGLENARKEMGLSDKDDKPLKQNMFKVV